MAVTPPRRRRRALVISLVVVGVVLLACCGVGAVIGAPFMREYPATVSTPDTLAGLSKQQNAQVDQLGAQIGRDLRQNANVDKAVAGLYAAPGDERRLVLVVGATGLIFSSEKEIDRAFAGMGSSGMPVSGLADYDAGELGGTVRCGGGTVSGLALSVCAWADHGSIGMGIFYGRQLAESADLFLKIRSGMLDRG